MAISAEEAEFALDCWVDPDSDAEPVTARTKNAGIPTIAARFARGLDCRFSAGVLSRTA